jgi:hypothetical protein
MKTADYESLAEAEFYIYAYFDEKDVPIYIKAGRGDQAHSHIQGCQAVFRDNNSPAFYRKLRDMLYKNLKPTVRIIAENLTQVEAFEVWEDFFIQAIGQQRLGTGPLLNEHLNGDGDAQELHPRVARPQQLAHARPHRTPARSTVRQQLEIEWQTDLQTELLAT